MPLASRSTSSKQSFRIVHNVPVGDTPYVRAKHAQLVEKDPNGAIALFWAAINAGDRVDSALKDMAIVMKQQDRPQEAIEAIKSFRHRCSDQAQESLDNVLIDLYKKCGRLDEQIGLLKHKLRFIQQGGAFNGKPTKTARSHGKKFQVSVKQETIRLLGNLGWAYMQQFNYSAAEAVYRKAELMEADGNRACNLGVCMMKQGKVEEAVAILERVRTLYNRDAKSLERAKELLKEIEEHQHHINPLTFQTTFREGKDVEAKYIIGLDWWWEGAGEGILERPLEGGHKHRLRVFEEMTSQNHLDMHTM